MFDKLNKMLDKAHKLGLRLPYLRDPLTQKPSVTLTMLFISFNFYLFTLINQFAKFFSDIDGAGQLLIITSGLYLGRSFSTKSGSSKDHKKED